VRTGLLTTVQDLGRPGFAHLGVPRSGAADQDALRLANRLVGNPESAAGVETTLTGCAVLMTEARWIAVTGARATVTVASASVAGAVADLSTAGAATSTAVGQGVAVYVPAGSVVDVGPAVAGVRSYLAVAGGVATEAVLGSRSADVLSGLGHERALAVGDLLPVGAPAGLPPDIPGLGLAPLRDPDDPVVVRLLPGPRDDWFEPDALVALATERYVVGAASNRTALRLEGPVLRRRRSGELVSEGMAPGAVQVPPDGCPVLFLADHPVTGGYPVIGCVDPADLSAAAQARPGTGIRFRLADRR
jgi:biotin-dependent carboxylase-like uncharacterized protein